MGPPPTPTELLPLSPPTPTASSPLPSVPSPLWFALTCPPPLSTLESTPDSTAVSLPSTATTTATTTASVRLSPTPMARSTAVFPLPTPTPTTSDTPPATATAATPTLTTAMATAATSTDKPSNAFKGLRTKTNRTKCCSLVEKTNCLVDLCNVRNESQIN